MTDGQLNATNALEQISEYGYFSDQVPACFATTSFSGNIVDIMNHVASENKNKPTLTQATNISTRKNETTRRTISLPNPHSFLEALKLISDNWDEVCKLANSEESHSPIVELGSYDPILEINSDKLRDIKAKRSSYVQNVKERIGAALGLRYKLELDIESCYDSIYTHSVTWALCGKK